MSSHRLLTTQQASEFLGVHEMTIYRWLKRGEIQGLKIGGRWRVDKDEIDRRFEENRAAGDNGSSEVSQAARSKG